MHSPTTLYNRIILVKTRMDFFIHLYNLNNARIDEERSENNSEHSRADTNLDKSCLLLPSSARITETFAFLNPYFSASIGLSRSRHQGLNVRDEAIQLTAHPKTREFVWVV